MGQTVTKSYMCCSVRDKDTGQWSEQVGAYREPVFKCIDAGAVLFPESCFLAVSPTHQLDRSKPRWLAVAGGQDLSIYRLPPLFDEVNSPVDVLCVHRLRLGAMQGITGLAFCDDTNPGYVAVAVAPLGRRACQPKRGSHSPGSDCRPSQSGGGPPQLKVFQCTGLSPAVKSTRSLPLAGTGNGSRNSICSEWTINGAFATLEGHEAEIIKILSNRQYLISADADGYVCVHHKRHKPQREFPRETRLQCHVGGLADITIDRSFLYTVGRTDNTIIVWHVPSLSQQLMNFPVNLAESELAMMCTPSSPTQDTVHWNGQERSTEVVNVTSPKNEARPMRNGAVARVNLLRRPQTRWCGVSFHSKGPDGPRRVPRGSLFVAAVLGAKSDIGPQGSGLLLEWSIGNPPGLKSANVAHVTPIMAMAYGPYDNGPLITADALGNFRVWELSLVHGLTLSQLISIESSGPQPSLQHLTDSEGGNEPYLLPPRSGWPTIAVESPGAVFVAVRGRLVMLKRPGETNVSGNFPGSPPKSPQKPAASPEPSPTN